MGTDFTLLREFALSLGNTIPQEIHGNFQLTVNREVAHDVWQRWAKEKTSEQRLSEISAISQLSEEELCEWVPEVVKEATGNIPTEVRRIVELYLLAIPSNIRFCLTKNNRSPKCAEDIQRFLPLRLGQFNMDGSPRSGALKAFIIIFSLIAGISAFWLAITVPTYKENCGEDSLLAFGAAAGFLSTGIILTISTFIFVRSSISLRFRTITWFNRLFCSILMLVFWLPALIGSVSLSVFIIKFFQDDTNFDSFDNLSVLSIRLVMGFLLIVSFLVSCFAGFGCWLTLKAFLEGKTPTLGPAPNSSTRA